MMQGAVSSRMPELPVVHLAHLVETGTWFAIGGVVGGAVLALLIRLRGWSWTCALPLLVAAPDHVVAQLGWLSSAPTRSRSQRSALARGATWPTCGPAATWRSEHGIASA